ncbi:dihydroxyacetone kinase subunit DhaL [Kineothrix sedimenti]|uniref:Dihydroxyacetone kinase subunit DhaL n=1 Tax=Kineothrix sedimenti TaxID=3123317 RepID=A0ABZ3EVQ0_9FIRM
MKVLTVEQTTDMIIRACDEIIKNKPYLTEIDSKIGDGDHGIGMSGGMEKAKSALEEKRPFQDVNSVFKTTGMAMLNSMGGASGVIFGSMFLGGIKGLETITELDGDSMAKIMRGSLEAIKERGKAQVGDKTMIDALEPAVLALEKGEKEDLAILLEAAKDGAYQGVENTKDYIAKFGRAKSLMERAIGYQDAGATSVFIIFDAMYKFVNAQ